jgi:outer membrane protein assembly factor BamB
MMSSAGTSAAGPGGTGIAGGSGVAGSGGLAGEAGGGEGGAAGESTWPVPLSDPETEAVAFQINAQHDGYQPKDELRLPLEPRWKHDFDLGYADVSFPVVARGRVFAAVGDHATKARVVALSLETGEELWSTPMVKAFYSRANVAYADERVFFANVDSVVTAFDAATGGQIWTRKLVGPLSLRSAPVVVDRVLYTVADRTLFAIDGEDGRDRWQVQLENVCYCSPTVSGGVVYLFDANASAAYDAKHGKLLWKRAMPPANGRMDGSTATTGTSPFSNGKLYVRSPAINLEIDAAQGVLGHSFAGDAIPAVDAGFIVATRTNQVLAQPPGGSNVAPWTYNHVNADFESGPLLVGGRVVALGREGQLVVLDAKDGTPLDETKLDGWVQYQGEVLSGDMVVGLTAAANRLLVPLRGSIIAF